MAFDHPWALLLTLAAVPLVLLYLRPAPAQRRITAAGRIWRDALAAEPLRAAWRPWRRWASSAVELLILALLVLAAAGPRILLQADASAGIALWPGLAGLAGGLLLMHWHLFHRRWMD